MKRFFLSIAIFSGQFVFGQATDSICRITFLYQQGHYAFGDPGKYGVGEIIEYSQQRNRSFQMTRCVRYTQSYNKRKDQVTVDTSFHGQLTRYLNANQFDKLFIELNITRDNFTAEFVKPYLKKPGKREIFKLLKKYRLKEGFKDDYFERREWVAALRKITNFYMLDSFMLKDKLSRESELVVTDVWNNLFIIVEKNGDTTTYRLDYFRLLGQPFRRVDNNDYSNGKRHINLEVNNAIYNVLPKRSLTRKIAGLNALKEEYIRWLASSNIELIDDIE